MKRIQKHEIPSLIQSHLPAYASNIIHVQPLFGMTNYIVKVTAPQLSPLIFRLFGEGFDRMRQNEIVRELSIRELAPKIYYSCNEYRIEEFVEGMHPECPQIFEYENGLMKRIVQKIHEFHSVELPENIPHSSTLQAFFNLNKIESIPKHKNQDLNQFTLLKNKFIAKFQEIHQLYLDNSHSIQSSLKFSHNDLNNLNILITSNSSIQLLDFEYSGYNHPAFDVANFMSQFCFVFSEDAPGFRVYRHLSREDIEKACSFYGEDEDMKEYVLLMLVFCNWKWGIWSLEIGRSELNSTFEPLEHGFTRYELMQHYKEQYFELIKQKSLKYN